MYVCVGRTEPHQEEGTPSLVGGERGEHEEEPRLESLENR